MDLGQDLDSALSWLDEAGLRRRGRSIHRETGGIVRVDGRRLVDFSSNDYLGLAADPRLARAAGEALAAEGMGAGAARLISGTHPLHEQLEGELAKLAGTEAALLFANGYAANTGAIQALAGRGDVLYSDSLNHASLIDGCRLSRADVRVFAHRDLEMLEGLLVADRERGGRRWIVVEGVYSMDGDLFPLDRLVELARAHGARIYVDEAHALGVLGRGGRGARELMGVTGEVDVVMGTLGKAFGGFGAFVGGSTRLREWLLNRARSFVFSTAPPPALAAGGLEALQIARTETERARRLHRNVARLKSGLRTMGVSLPPEVPGHIAPVPTGVANEAVRQARALERRGYLVGCVRPPSVPDGGSRLRIGVSAAHTDEHVDGLLRALEETRTELTERATAGEGHG